MVEMNFRDNIDKEDGKIYSFDAFISYSRKDTEFAKILGDKLGTYTPPKGLNVPQRRLKVFRDENDIIGNDYFKAIDNHLSISKKLIVICSPNAYKSPMVNDEIHRFTKRNGAKNIIPVLIDGLPNNLIKEVGKISSLFHKRSVTQ